MQVVDALNGMTVKLNDQITSQHACLFGWTALGIIFKRHYQHSGFNRQLVVTNNTARDRNVLSGEANVTSANSAISDQSPSDKFRCIDRSCETDSLSWKNHRGIHADNFASSIYEGPAGVSWIQRRISLYN